MIAILSAGGLRHPMVERLHVENRHDLAIAQERGAGNHQLIAERSAQLLEDQLLFLDHRIDRHTQAAVAGLDDQHGRSGSRGAAGGLPQQRRERDDWNRFAFDRPPPGHAASFRPRHAGCAGSPRWEWR